MKKAIIFLSSFLGLGLFAAPPPDFMVVDLRAWKTARFFATAEELPGGGTANALYKTDYVALRKVPKKNWYVAMNEITAEQRRRVGAGADASREDVAAKLRARTGLSFDVPEKAFPGFAKFNPVVPAREAAQMFSREAKRAAAGEKSLTWLSGKVGAALELSAENAQSLGDADALAKELAAARADYVCIPVVGGREITFRLVRAMKGAGLPAMLRLSCKGEGETRVSYESIVGRVKTVAAWSARLGKDVVAWWFDDALAEDGFNDDVAAEFTKAARAGNSEAMVTFNPGRQHLCRWSGSCDFTAGDVRNPFTYVCYGPSADGAQWHVRVSLGEGDGVRFGDEQLAAWLRGVVAAGGAATLGVRPGGDGRLAQADGELFSKAVRRVKKSAKAAARAADSVALAEGYVLRVNSETGDDDAGDGSALRPFKTPRRAADAANDMRFSRGYPAGGITVELTGRFNYPSGTGFTLGSADGGPSPDKPVVWTGSAEGATFSGAYRLDPAGFKPVTDPETLKRFRNKDVAKKVRVYDLKPLGVKEFDGMPAQFLQWDGMELYCNGRSMPIARYPDSGWMEIAEVVDSGAEVRVSAAEGWQGPPQLNILRPGTIGWGKDPEPCRWNVEKGVYLFGFWCWDWAVDTLRVASIDQKQHRLTFEGRHVYGIGNCMGFKQPRRYYAYNMLEVLDAPGEWFIDRDERLLYFLPGPDGFGNLELAAQSRSPLVEIVGAQNVVLRNVKFEHSLTYMLSVSDCTRVTVDGVDVSWSSRNGARLAGGTENVFTNCVIGWTGDVGLSVSGGDRYSLTACSNRITGCEVHHSGRLSRHGACISVAGVGVILDHNYVHDAPYIAVNYVGNDHLIEYNEIACAMMEGSDGGATYSGRDWGSQGNVLRHNFVHHLGAAGVEWERKNGIPCDFEPVTDNVMVNGFYLDDCDSGDVVTNNVLWKTGLGVLVGGGHDNVIRDNFVLDCDVALHLDSRGASMSMFDYREDAPLENSGAMLAKIVQFGYTEPPWSVRYPKLVKITETDVRLPIGTEFVGNVAFGCGTFMNADKLALETLHGNLLCSGNKNFGKTSAKDAAQFPQGDRKMKEKFLLANGNKKIESLDPAAALVSDAFRRLCPDFPPIPMDQIGRPGAGHLAPRHAKRGR